MSDLDFWFDPVCPFAWVTSQWVRLVAEQRSYDVLWRPISLRLLNAAVDYAADFPPEYEAGHTAGLRLLRVVAATEAAHGPSSVGPLYAELGARIWDGPQGQDVPGSLSAAWLEPVLSSAGLPASLASSLDDTSWDAGLQASTDAAIAVVGAGVGTPVLQFAGGAAFFGPVISRVPSPARALELWDHVVGLASFEGFAELKRSLREVPQLRALGVEPGEVGVTEQWSGGSRRAPGE